jgi:hypothetical protein
VFDETATEFGMTVSLAKTKVMYQRRPDTNKSPLQEEEKQPLVIKIRGQQLEEVEKFSYLGGLVTSGVNSKADMTLRRGLAAKAFAGLWGPVFGCIGLKQQIKLRVLKTMVLPVLLYGSQTWTLYAESMRKVEGLQLSFLLRVVQKRRREMEEQHFTYVDLLEQCGMESMETTIRKNQLLWIGRVCRMSSDRLPKQVFYGAMKDIAEVVGRTTNSAKTFWQNIEESLQLFKIDSSDWLNLVVDEGEWLEVVQNGAKECERKWRETKKSKREKRHERENKKDKNNRFRSEQLE